MFNFNTSTTRFAKSVVFFEDTVEDEEVELHTEEEMAEEQNMEDVYHIFNLTEFNLTECSSDIDSAFGAESEDDF